MGIAQQRLFFQSGRGFENNRLDVGIANDCLPVKKLGFVSLCSVEAVRNA
jgi:hypothetical protein